MLLLVGPAVSRARLCGLWRAPRAVDGRLDLSRWDFRVDGDVPLVGSWQICWNQLLAPGDACPSGWQPVPVRGLWSEETVGSPFGGRGVATYRLRIALAPDAGPLALVAGGPLTAHRLFIDGVARGGLGVVGETPETTVAEVFNRVYELAPGSSEVELQVQVANFEFRGGGLRRLWYLGRVGQRPEGCGPRDPARGDVIRGRPGRRAGLSDALRAATLRARARLLRR